tara:strand:- start:68 stop:223 length:156 start_codon:yes stop_codon:yes gene_type:complete
LIFLEEMKSTASKEQYEEFRDMLMRFRKKEMQIGGLIEVLVTAFYLVNPSP